MSLQKIKMSEQSPEIRNKNFDEVALGYTEAQAKEEAKRCLQCRNMPCVNGCPVNVAIPDFIKRVAEGSFAQAYEIIKKTNSLPAVCGRVCPQEKQCEAKCVRAKKGESVAIGRLERFCADYAMKHGTVETQSVRNQSNGEKIAVVGSGPAGLTCAGDLAKRGYTVDVFEALHIPGGVLVYGIPEFRLPKMIVRKEIDSLAEIGVNIKTNMFIGRVLSVDDLFDMGYSAVFIGSGAGQPGFLNIDGENLNGVFSANEYLTRINLMKAYDENYDTPIIKSRSAAVIGGGNVAMDAARCAKRLGASSVYIIYRRGEHEMPARLEEIHHAKEEGVIFKTLTNPIKINSDGNGGVKSMECAEMILLDETDGSGRRKSEVKPGSNFTLDVDTVIIAVGTNPNPIINMTTPGLEADKRGCIATKDDGITTTREGVFAGGDAVTGAATVILAMGAGKEAAVKIHEYVMSKEH